jgi:hypothetical protein
MFSQTGRTTNKFHQNTCVTQKEQFQGKQPKSVRAGKFDKKQSQKKQAEMFRIPKGIKTRFPMY